MIVVEILQALYDSEINFHISTFWDGGFRVGLGDEVNGFGVIESFDTMKEAVVFLQQRAISEFPDSEFVKKLI